MFTFSSFLQENSNKFKISLGLPLANMIISTSHPHPSFSGCTHAMPMRIIKGPKINGQNFDGVCFLFTSCLYSKNFTWTKTCIIQRFKIGNVYIFPPFGNTWDTLHNFIVIIWCKYILNCTYHCFQCNIHVNFLFLVVYKWNLNRLSGILITDNLDFFPSNVSGWL